MLAVMPIGVFMLSFLPQRVVYGLISRRFSTQYWGQVDVVKKWSIVAMSRWVVVICVAGPVSSGKNIQIESCPLFGFLVITGRTPFKIFFSACFLG